MAYSKAKLKSSGADICLPIKFPLYVLFNDILISLTYFVGMDTTMLYNTSVLTELQAFLKSINS
jgi:hypothetical protein